MRHAPLRGWEVRQRNISCIELDPIILGINVSRCRFGFGIMHCSALKVGTSPKEYPNDIFEKQIINKFVYIHI